MRNVSAVIALMCAAGAIPAAAQNGASLLEAAGLPAAIAGKINLAMSQVSSYRVRFTGTTMQSILTVLPSQKRAKLVESHSVWGAFSETVFADGRAYTRAAGGEWRVREHPDRAPGAPSPAQAFLAATKIVLLADRVENGTTVGAYEVDITPPSAGVQEPVTFICIYDKTTYLLRRCGNDMVMQTFEGWNDPANVVDVPVVAAPSSR